MFTKLYLLEKSLLRLNIYTDMQTYYILISHLQTWESCVAQEPFKTIFTNSFKSSIG